MFSFGAGSGGASTIFFSSALHGRRFFSRGLNGRVLNSIKIEITNIIKTFTKIDLGVAYHIYVYIYCICNAD